MPANKRSATQILIILCLFFNPQVFAQKLIPPPFVLKEWQTPYQPFRIVGNLYYVGTYDLACYLIATPKGNILINTGLAESVGPIKSNIESLGFKFSDIKILLATHAHFDHVAGMAEIKEMTGARMMINEKDAQALADGGNSDFIFGGKGSTFKPVKADRLLKDNDTVRLGNMAIITLNHPGHTQGANSFLFEVRDKNRNYRVLIANMPTLQDQTNLKGMDGYPDIAKDYAYTFDALKKLKFDIWLSSHASQFRLHQKHKTGDVYRPDAFINRPGYDETVGNLEKAYLQRLAASPFSAKGWDTVKIKLTKLTPTVYMMEGRGGNIGLCVGGDGTFIIDDQFAPLSDKIIKAIGTVTGKPVQFVINTHFHGDHAGGNTNFGDKGAIIVSHENARKRLEADSFFKAQAANNPNISPAGLPKITFTQSMTFHYNTETVRIFHIADAHTDGDAIIWFKESNVLHMGDVFVRYGLPYIDMPSGGNINGMIETINFVIKEIDDKTVIIPGHGQLSNKQDLVAYNTMLTTVRDRIKKLMDEGKSYDDIIKAHPISDIEKRESNANSFIKVVYDSQLRKYN